MKNCSVKMAAGAAAVCIAHALPLSSLSLHQRLLGAAMGVVALIAGMRYLQERPARLPFLEFALLQFYVYWGVPTLTWDFAGAHALREESVTQALVASNVVTLAVAALYRWGAALGGSVRGAVNRVLPSSTPELGQLFPLWLLLCAAIHGGAGQYAPLEIRAAVVAIGSPIPLLVYAWLQRRWLWAAAVVLSIAGFATGMAEPVVAPLLAAGILHVLRSGRLPITVGAAALAILFVLQPVKAVYRDRFWSGTNKSDVRAASDISSAVEGWRDAFITAWIEGNPPEHAGSLWSRLNALSTIALTVERVPAVVPYADGRPWISIVASPVPRLFWSDKPNQTTENNDRFNVALGRQSRWEAEGTTLDFPLVADGYWNLGWLGVALLGVAMGVTLGAISNAFAAPSWANRSVALALFVDLSAASHLGATVTAIPMWFIGVGTACWVAIWAARVSPRVRPKGTRRGDGLHQVHP